MRYRIGRCHLLSRVAFQTRRGLSYIRKCPLLEQRSEKSGPALLFRKTSISRFLLRCPSLVESKVVRFGNRLQLDRAEPLLQRVVKRLSSGQTQLCNLLRTDKQDLADKTRVSAGQLSDPSASKCPGCFPQG